MKRNFFQSIHAERISLVFVTITGCFLVYWFFLKKEQRDCGPMIVTTETFYNPGTASGSVQPEEKVAIFLKDKPVKLKQKNKEEVNDLFPGAPAIIINQGGGERQLVLLDQVNEAKIQLLEERDRLQEKILEMRDRSGRDERGERIQEELDKLREAAGDSRVEREKENEDPGGQVSAGPKK